MTAFLQFCVNTLGYLRLMTVSDLIDIAILSFMFYKCIGIFQRTNAAKVAKALLIIVVAMWISYQFNLNAINFILSKAVELGLLALVVIFQPEIRRFLEKVGSNSVSGFSRYFRSEAPVTDLEQAIAETVEAYVEGLALPASVQLAFSKENEEIQWSQVPEEVSYEVYRIMQELLSNILKHSGATEIDVTLTLKRKLLILQISNNGKNYCSDEVRGKGIGLTTIQERAKAVGGLFTTDIQDRSQKFKLEISLSI